MREFVLVVGVVFSLSVLPAQAITITLNTDADQLAAAVTAGNTGLVVNSATLSGNSTSGGAVASSGTYDNPTGTYGIGAGIVIASGDAADYGDGPSTSGGNTTNFGAPATAAQELLLDPITGGSLNHNDVTELTIDFSLLPDAGNTLFFNVVFGSDEYAEYVNSAFIDAFGLFVNGTNIAFANGQPININNSGMAFIGGTELDGVMTTGGSTVMTFSATLDDPTGSNTVKFIIADSGDANLDSVAYISALGAVDPGDPGGPVPEPGSMLLLGTGLVALARSRRRRSR